MTLQGRILRGNKAEDFETLSDNSDRRLVFFLPDSELKKLQNEEDLNKLKMVGWTEDAIKEYLKKDFSFKLLTFPADSNIAKIATWDNVLSLALEAYPEIANKLKNNFNDLKKYNYDELVKLAGYDFEDIKDPKDNRYMNLENYLKSNGELAQTRGFLYHTLNLNKKFTGDGTIPQENDKPPIQELIGLNRRISDIVNYNLLDLKIQLPDTEITKEIKHNFKLK